jgi:hypothetical protein
MVVFHKKGISSIFNEFQQISCPKQEVGCVVSICIWKDLLFIPVVDFCLVLLVVPLWNYKRHE